MQTNTSSHFVDLVKQAYEQDAKAGRLEYKNSFYVQRGPYDIVSVMSESINSNPYTINGPVIDLFDPQLPVLAKKTVDTGHQALLFNVGRVANKKQPQVVASASRVYEEVVAPGSYSFVSKSPVNTVNSMRILLPAEPKSIVLTDSKGEKLADVKSSWDASSHTCFLGFENSPEGTHVKLSW